MSRFNLKKQVRPNILDLVPYRCARDDYSSGILLDANENSFGNFLNEKYARYPDPHQLELVKKIAELHSLPQDSVFIGVGSDEVLDLAVRIFCRPGLDSILITPPTYGMYSVVAKINDVNVVKVDLKDDFQLDLDRVLNALSQQQIKIIFLCSPGNPTGTLLRKDDVKKILNVFDGLVIVDEAYIDFCSKDDSLVSWVNIYPNLMVSKTLSKAFGLAGIRIGMGFASSEIIKVFRNTKAPYNISLPASEIAIQALSFSSLEIAYDNISKIIEERKRLVKEFKNLKGLGEVLGGNHANFILVQVLNSDGVPSNDSAMNLYKSLADQMGIIVRFRGNEVGCLGCIRVTVGNHAENSILLDKMGILLKNI